MRITTMGKMLPGWLLAATLMLSMGHAQTVDDGFNPNVGGGDVHTMTHTRHGTLIGGDFNIIDGHTRNRVALLRADGSVDPFFNPNVQNGVVFGSTIAGDGDFVFVGSFAHVGGATRIGIARFNAAGDPVAPWVAPTIDGTVHAVAEMPASGNYKLYIGGQFGTVDGQARTRVARLNFNGTLDTGFEPPGFSGTVYALAVQPDGKLLVAGNIGILGQPARSNVYRLNEDGSLDDDFEALALVTGDRTVHSLVIEDDGRILAGGEFGGGGGFIVRLNSDGGLDNLYQPPTLNDAVHAIDLQPDGRAVIAGDFTAGVGPHLRIARLHENGTVDQSFATLANPGNTVRAVQVQDDGWILLGGDFDDVTTVVRNRVARLDEHGMLEQSLVVFEGAKTSPFFRGEVHTAAHQSDGMILVGGRFNSFNGVSRQNLARLHPNGAVQGSFAPLVDGQVEAIAILPDDRILIAGKFSEVNGEIRRRAAILHPDGQLDEDFYWNPGFPSYHPTPKAASVYVQDDGKILVAGNFGWDGNSPRLGLARLWPDGSPDTGFAPPAIVGDLTGEGEFLRGLAVDSEGRILATGRFQEVAGQTQACVVRMGPDGSYDPDFVFEMHSTVGSCYSVALGGNAVVVGGRLGYHFNGEYQAGLAALNDNGIAQSASALAAPWSHIRAIAPRAHGFNIGGQFTLVDGEDKRYVGALHSVDTPQPGYGDAGIGESQSTTTYSDDLNSLTVLPDGKVLAAGSRIGAEIGGLERQDVFRISNAGGPIRQSITFDPSDQRLIWSRSSASAPALLGQPRVMVSQSCCNPETFEAASGGGAMTRVGEDWWLDDFEGYAGKFYVRIDYRVGNSTSSSIYRTPIQRLYAPLETGMPKADLELKLVLSEEQAAPGDVILVDFMVDNRGPDTATMPAVTVDLPAGFTLLDFNVDQGGFIPEENLWKLEDMPTSGPGSHGRLTLQVAVNLQTPHKISGLASAPEFDPDYNNNGAQIELEVLFSRSDLMVSNTVDPAAALPGEEVSFTLMVENLGPEAADGVVVQNYLPTGHGYQNHNASAGTYNPASGEWQVGTLASGGSAELTIRTVVHAAGGYVSVATVDSHSLDPEPNNNLAIAAIDPFTDLSVRIRVHPSLVAVGELVAYTIDLVNLGPREATGVLVQHGWPDSLIYQSHSVSAGHYEPAMASWEIGMIGPGESAMLTLGALVTGTEERTVTVTADSETTELDPSNNADAVTFEIMVPDDILFRDRFE